MKTTDADIQHALQGIATDGAGAAPRAHRLARGAGRARRASSTSPTRSLDTPVGHGDGRRDRPRPRAGDAPERGPRQRARAARTPRSRRGSSRRPTRLDARRGASSTSTSPARGAPSTSTSTCGSPAATSTGASSSSSARSTSARRSPTARSRNEPDNARAVRAAGTACGSNPIPIVVPCHRVVRSGGEIGNYGGGPEMKRFLLELEGALPG